jgi:hypothetical protein
MQAEQIVIGGTIDAVFYAYENNLKIIYVDRKPPEKFEFFKNKVSKLDAYQRKLFALSLCGQVPIGDNVRAIRIDADKRLRIVTKNARTISLQYENLIIFDEEGVSGLPPPVKKAKEEYDVIDWIDVRRGMVHEHQWLESGSNFVKMVHFYPSERVYGKHNKKDAIAISRISGQEVERFEYSPTSVRLKVESMMRAAGIRGPKNGVCQETGKPKHYAIKLEQRHRDIKKIHRDTYRDTESLRFVQNSDIRIHHTSPSCQYAIKLEKLLEP